MSAFVWVPLAAGAYFIGRGYLVANQAIYTQLRVALEYRGYRWPDVKDYRREQQILDDAEKEDMYGTFTKRPLKASPLQTSEQKLLTGNLRPYATWLGNLMGLGVGGLSYVLVYQTVKRQLTNPADLLKGRKSMRAAIESARPLPPSLTPRRFYAYMAPHKITRSSLREFNRLYARTVLIHWLALTWAVVFASIAQPLLESKTICDFVPRSGKHPKEAKLEEEDRARFENKRQLTRTYD